MQQRHVCFKQKVDSASRQKKTKASPACQTPGSCHPWRGGKTRCKNYCSWSSHLVLVLVWSDCCYPWSNRTAGSTGLLLPLLSKEYWFDRTAAAPSNKGLLLLPFHPFQPSTITLSPVGSWPLTRHVSGKQIHIAQLSRTSLLKCSRIHSPPQTLTTNTQIHIAQLSHTLLFKCSRIHSPPHTHTHKYTDTHCTTLTRCCTSAAAFTPRHKHSPTSTHEQNQQSAIYQLHR